MKLNITDKIFILTSLIMSLSISALTIHAEVPTPSKDQKNGMWGYVDKQGKWVVKPKYQEVSEYKVLPGGVKAAFVVNKDKCGYIDEKGKGIGEGISFSSIDSISPKAALVRKNDKYGVVDWGMKYILKPVFEDVKNVDGKWFIATQKKRKGVFSNEGQIVLNPEYDEITVGSPIWLKTGKNGSYGYFDMQSGKELIEPIYQDVKEMFEIDGLGYIPFCSSLNNWGLYGREGRVVLDSKYSEIEPIPASHVIALTEYAGGYKLYYPERNMFFDYTPGLKWNVGGFSLREGKVKSSSRDIEYSLTFDKLFPGGNFSTVTDPDGNLVSRYEKPCVRERKDKNIYMVQTDKSKYDVYDINYHKIAENIEGLPSLQNGWLIFGNKAISPDRMSYDVKKGAYSTQINMGNNGKDEWYLFDNGVLSSEGYEKINDLGANLRSVRKNGLYGVKNKDSFIIPLSLEEDAKYVPEREVLIGKKNGKYGVCNLAGKEIIAYEYNNIVPTDADSFEVWRNGRVGLADEEGGIYIEPQYDSIDFKDEFILVQSGGKYGIVNYSGDVLLSPQFDEVSYLDNSDASYYRTRKGDKYGALTEYGKQFLPAVYDEDDLYLDGYLLVVYNGLKKTYYTLDGSIYPAKKQIYLTKMYLDHNIYDSNGNKAMKINYDFIAVFLHDPGDYVTVHARVFRKNGQPARKKNGEEIYHSVVFNPAYRSTKYSDMWITMPNANISQGAGKVDYYVTLTFTDKNGKLLPLNGSNRCDFYMTRR